MRPILFRWQNFTMWSYPAMLYLGLLAGIIAGNVAAHVAGIDALGTYVASLVLIVPSLAGARLLYVVAHWPVYRGDHRRIWDRKQGGYVMYGGLPLVLLLSIPLLKMLQLDFGTFWDVATFTILVGMIFARVGCLMNGCCTGRASKAWFVVSLPNQDGVWEKRIPTQVLEASCAFVLLVFAVLTLPRVPFHGALFLLVAFGYGSTRFVLEFAREHSKDAETFTLVHVISLVIAIVSISTLTICWR